jgi:transcriptional regulator with XRE-family HTH domain
MSLSPLSTAQEARKAVAEQLAEIRKDAGISKRELAARSGWHESKSSRIESVKTVPSDADIRIWCTVCGVPQRSDDLIAASRRAESLYIQWRRRHWAGMRRAQDELLPLYERTKAFRVYCSNVMPGFLQTAPYAEALMTRITEFQGTPNDVNDAVAARMERARILRKPDHTFAVILEETVLRYRIGDAAVMAGQLGHLLEAMSLPSISLGVTPSTAHRAMWPLEAFYMFDASLVTVETLTAEINVTAPGEIDDYAHAFTELAKLAVYGQSARSLITSAIAALD